MNTHLHCLLKFLFCYSFSGGVDYNSGPYTVTFPAGVTTASFNIPITDDNISESNEDIQIGITISSLPSRVGVSNPGHATVTIVDSDNDSKIFISIYDLKP